MIKITVKKSKTPRFNFDFSDNNLYLKSYEKGYQEGFKKGYREGVIKATVFIIENMLIEGDPIKRVAKIAYQTEDFILAIQSRLVQEGKLLPPAKSI